VYERLLGRVTPDPASFLRDTWSSRRPRVAERYQLTLSDSVHGSRKNYGKNRRGTLPSDLQGRFPDAKAALEKSMAGSSGDACSARFDVAWMCLNAGKKMKYQLDATGGRGRRLSAAQPKLSTRHADSFETRLSTPIRLCKSAESQGLASFGKYDRTVTESCTRRSHTDATITR